MALLAVNPFASLLELQRELERSLTAPFPNLESGAHVFPPVNIFVGHFERRFSISDSGAYDRDRIQARFRDGVLEVMVPRSESSKPRRIPVAAA